MFRTEFTIEWGDCDEAGIVFYPNYFYWFDSTFQRFLRARGLGQRVLKQRFGAITPIVDARGQFRAPARYDDPLAAEAVVAEWAERRFRVDYRLTVGERLVAEGYELRAWARIDAEGRMAGAPIDAAFRDAMS
ncbi:MAG: thioesterase family protein [Methylobacteriaceae bacterium]|nr:thioesterase family protein [Methylobacteriaceae bacterium]